MAEGKKSLVEAAQQESFTRPVADGQGLVNPARQQKLESELLQNSDVTKARENFRAGNITADRLQEIIDATLHKNG